MLIKASTRHQKAPDLGAFSFGEWETVLREVLDGNDKGDGDSAPSRHCENCLESSESGTLQKSAHVGSPVVVFVKSCQLSVAGEVTSSCMVRASPERATRCCFTATPPCN